MLNFFIIIADLVEEMKYKVWSIVFVYLVLG